MPETKQCQNCHNSFVIDAEDFNFYDKIQAPAPTWCPECRCQRRMTWRNERSLYKTKCVLTSKEVITCFSPDSHIVVYDRDAWWSDKWDPFLYGAEYDFNKPFFIQFRELLGRIPMPSLFNSRCTNSEYGNHNGELKNAYLVFATWQGENIMYGAKAHSCKDSLDILASQNSELCYEIVNSIKLYHSAFLENCENCTDSYFLYECRGCNNCFGCTNLRNKSYYILNQSYGKEEYFEKIKEFGLESYKQLSEVKQRFIEIKTKSLHKFARIYNSPNSTGDNLANVSNSKQCFDANKDVRDSKFCINATQSMNDSYDGYGVGAKVDLLYESVDTGVSGSRFYFDIFIWGGSDVIYCYGCHGSHNMFGCIGLHNKSYCILNKQYSKEEYEELVPKIIKHMNDMPYVDKKGRIYKYGEFFPPELSPFSYNETIAQEYFPLTKEQAIEQGYSWKDPEERNYKIQIPNDQLPDNIRDVEDDIVNKVIGCAHAQLSTSQVDNPDRLEPACNEQCTTAFKIIPDELQFYRKMNLPLPRLCSNCRHYQRLKQRNPLKLWHRKCMCAGKKLEIRNEKLETSHQYQNTIKHFHGDNSCPNEFETSYSPNRQEIIYCEQCYNAEVV